MKILMMTNTYTPIVGGLEKSIQIFSEQFRAKGHEVKIVAPVFPDMPANEKDVIRVPALEKFVGTNFSLSLPLPGEIQDLVEKFKPDIVHSHHPFLMGDLALRLCGQNKIPLVFTYHTMFEYYTDAFAMDQQVVQQFVVELATGYANMADQVIVPSESVGQMLKERKVNTPTSVVPTGIDVNYFAPADSNFRKKFKIPNNAFVVGHTGRLAPEKNLIFLTESVAEFLKQKKDAHFLIVGGGPSEREMKKIFHALEVQNQVHFAGIQKGKALVQAYHTMDVFAFASKSETQGIVLAEAMAAGLPVVALDAPGVREVVRDQVNGRLLNVESKQEFASSLLWCASLSPEGWNKVKKQALETANGFSSDICAQKALKIYETVSWRDGRFTQEQTGQWDALLGRFKTELDLIFHYGRAAGSALLKSAATKTPVKEKLEKNYAKQIKSARHDWMLLLKKIRKQIKDAPEAEKGKLESSAEALAHKIREQESELDELCRIAVGACEDFEKFLNDACAQIKSEFESSGEKKSPEDHGGVEE